MNTATKGAVGELEAAIDLMRRGYPTFRALSPACVCDLITIIDGRLLRVEVRTGQCQRYIRADTSRFDILAIVDIEGVSYIGADGKACFGLPKVYDFNPRPLRRKGSSPCPV